jgi:predicted ATPase
MRQRALVVFVDGVDGAGKTTMIQQLAQSLPTGTAHIADPLWHYLAAVKAPTDFATWVVNNPATEIATALIDACTHRLADVRQHLTSIGPDGMVFVDRGPHTVLASARAHAATGTAADTDAEPDEAITRLQSAVAQTVLVADCMSVELRVTNYDTILPRLSDNERNSPPYVRYLKAFLQYFNADAPWPGIERIVADASDGITASLRSVRAGLRLDPQHGDLVP